MSRMQNANQQKKRKRLFAGLCEEQWALGGLLFAWLILPWSRWSSAVGHSCGSTIWRLRLGGKKDFESFLSVDHQSFLRHRSLSWLSSSLWTLAVWWRRKRGTQHAHLLYMFTVYCFQGKKQYTQRKNVQNTCKSTCVVPVKKGYVEIACAYSPWLNLGWSESFERTRLALASVERLLQHSLR